MKLAFRTRVAALIVLGVSALTTACLSPPPGGPGAASSDSQGDKLNNQAEVDAVVARLTALRQQNGKPPPKLMKGLQVMASDDATAVEHGEIDANSGLGRLLHKTLWKFDDGGATVVRGWVFSTTAPEQTEFPAPLLRASTLRVAVGVARSAGPPPHLDILLTASLPGDALGDVRQ